MKKLTKGIVGAAILVLGIFIKTGVSAEAAPLTAFDHLHYCPLNDTYKTSERNCLTVQNILSGNVDSSEATASTPEVTTQQKNAQVPENKETTSTDKQRTNATKEVKQAELEPGSTPADKQQSDLEDPTAATDTAPATTYCPKPQDGTGYHWNTDNTTQQGNARHNGNADGQHNGTGYHGSSNSNNQRGHHGGY